jgi:hypothetical protein
MYNKMMNRKKITVVNTGVDIFLEQFELITNPVNGSIRSVSTSIQLDPDDIPELTLILNDVKKEYDARKNEFNCD